MCAITFFQHLQMSGTVDSKTPDFKFTFQYLKFYVHAFIHTNLCFIIKNKNFVFYSWMRVMNWLHNQILTQILRELNGKKYFLNYFITSFYRCAIPVSLVDT